MSPIPEDTPKLTSTVGLQAQPEAGELRSTIVPALPEAPVGQLSSTLEILGSTATIPEFEVDDVPLVVQPGASIVRRDEGKPYTIVSVTDGKYGKTVKIVNDKGDKINLDLADLEGKLGTKDSAWHW